MLTGARMYRHCRNSKMRSSGVCRRLFEPLDRDQFHEEFKSWQLEERLKFRNKYNYDTERDVPLQGKYEWTRLDVSEGPAVYFKTYNIPARRKRALEDPADLVPSRRRKLDFSEEMCHVEEVRGSESDSVGSAPPSTSSSPALSTTSSSPALSTTSSSSPVSSVDAECTPRRQLLISDFMKTSKRPSTEKPPRL